ncbi:MAG TPA: ATP-binding protein [Pseudonocardiaceae bacterium]|nr:ATP-binding protein [Pseudonocardiaceae bacterium]
MIIAMAGLPGVGKSALAGALATRLHAAVLDKDRIRAGLFPSSHVYYTDDQNDFCIDVMYRTAEWLLRRDDPPVVILDGCTYTRAGQIAGLRRMASRLGEPLRVIECTCDDQVALARIADDGNHLAGNRNAALYRKLQAAAQAITGPKLVVDTGSPFASCVADCVAYATEAP